MSQYPPPGGQVPPPAGDPVPQRSEAPNKKLVCGILAILLGHFGIHKFILGMTTPGLIMLLVTVLTCGFGGIVMWVIGIIEGIMYLTKTDDQFYEEYMVGKKQWF